MLRFTTILAGLAFFCLPCALAASGQDCPADPYVSLRITGHVFRSVRHPACMRRGDEEAFYVA